VARVHGELLFLAGIAGILGILGLVELLDRMGQLESQRGFL
jgi:hypothetical protein